MNFKTLEEMQTWNSNCRELFHREYIPYTKKAFDKWKEDGNRFLEPSFFEKRTFPLLNDGRPEIDEWLEGNFLTSVLLDEWPTEIRYNEVKEYLENMNKIYRSRIFIDESTKEQFERYSNKLDDIICFLEEEEER